MSQLSVAEIATREGITVDQVHAIQRSALAKLRRHPAALRHLGMLAFELDNSRRGYVVRFPGDKS